MMLNFTPDFPHFLHYQNISFDCVKGNFVEIPFLFWIQIYGENIIEPLVNVTSFLIYKYRIPGTNFPYQTDRMTARQGIVHGYRN